MFVEPISADFPPRSPLAALQNEDDWIASTLPWEIEPGSFPIGKSAGRSTHIEQLIEELKWENERLLITRRNPLDASGELQVSDEAADALNSLREHLLGTQGLAAQANLSPDLVLSLL